MRKRSAYRPKPADHRAFVKMALKSIRHEPLPEENAQELELIVFTALEEVVRGRAGPNEWNSVARAINHAWVLAKVKIGPEVMPFLTLAEDGMRAGAKRYYAADGKRPLILSGDGLRAVRDAIFLWGDQLRLCTVGEVDEATRLVQMEYWKKQRQEA